MLPVEIASDLEKTTASLVLLAGAYSKESAWPSTLTLAFAMDRR